MKHSSWQKDGICLVSRVLSDVCSALCCRYLYMDALSLAAAKSLQSCPSLCDPIDGSPPGSPIPGILQARTLERVAISFSNAWKWKVKVKSLSCVQLLTTPWTAAHQAPPSMGFSRQEYWSGVPLPSPELILAALIIFLWASVMLSRLNSVFTQCHLRCLPSVS